MKELLEGGAVPPPEALEELPFVLEKLPARRPRQRFLPADPSRAGLQSVPSNDVFPGLETPGPAVSLEAARFSRGKAYRSIETRRGGNSRRIGLKAER